MKAVRPAARSSPRCGNPAVQPGHGGGKGVIGLGVQVRYRLGQRGCQARGGLQGRRRRRTCGLDGQTRTAGL